MVAGDRRSHYLLPGSIDMFCSILVHIIDISWFLGFGTGYTLNRECIYHIYIGTSRHVSG